MKLTLYGLPLIFAFATLLDSRLLLMP